MGNVRGAIDARRSDRLNKQALLGKSKALLPRATEIILHLKDGTTQSHRGVSLADLHSRGIIPDDVLGNISHYVQDGRHTNVVSESV